jgi:hypothetical protein
MNKLPQADVIQRHELADEIFKLIEGKKSKNIAPTLLGAYTLVIWKGGYDKKFALRTAAEYIDMWYADQEKEERNER